MPLDGQDLAVGRFEAFDEALAVVTEGAHLEAPADPVGVDDLVVEGVDLDPLADRLGQVAAGGNLDLVGGGFARCVLAVLANVLDQAPVEGDVDDLLATADAEDGQAGISGPAWTIGGVGDATVAEGRLLYVKGRVIRVRRIRDGVDRALVTLPESDALIAAGSTGLAVAIENAKGTNVYRLPWRVIDLTLAAR